MDLTSKLLLKNQCSQGVCQTHNLTLRTLEIQRFCSHRPSHPPLSVMAMATFDTFSEKPPLEHSVVPHSPAKHSHKAESQLYSINGSINGGRTCSNSWQSIDDLSSKKPFGKTVGSFRVLTPVSKILR